MKSTNNYEFSQVPQARIERSTFNRNHGHKTTFDEGYLVPIYVDEVLPGDTLNLNMTGFARLATPITPVMDNVKMDTHFFAVPIRLLWDNWQKFNGEQENPGDSTDYVVPQIVSPALVGWESQTIADYMGIPTRIANLSTSALFHRAYNLVYNDWYRDQNLQDSVVINKGDGPDVAGDYSLLRRGKYHDYFTSCLPWPQKGESVNLPLGLTAPILTDSVPSISDVSVFSTSADEYRHLNSLGANLKVDVTTGLESSSIYTDLSSATASTINELRQAFQVQRMLERDARGGTRYIEVIKSHFGVTSPDSRLQRPEFLGGGTSNVIINQVEQTSETNTTPQGNLAAYGTATQHNHGFTKSFTEHCIIIGLLSTRADLTYQEGLNRMFSRSTRFDFYWPALAHLGEQAVLNKEIYAQGTAADDEVFGYQERFAEMRYKPSLISGKMRSSDPQSLDIWHLAQDFASLPVLNASFIVENAPIDRIIAVPSEPHFIYDSYFKLRHTRPMPTYSVPGQMDHF